MEIYFDHEKLRVYQESIEFVSWTQDVLDGVPKRIAVVDQLDRASTSIPLNIAEGNGKFTAPDRCRFWDTARGSALEAAACLDVMVAKRLVQKSDITQGKETLQRIVSMLIGLIKSISADRVYETQEEYEVKS
jgi:four helix bundle protein